MKLIMQSAAWRRKITGFLMALMLVGWCDAAQAGPLERPRQVVVTVDGRTVMKAKVVWWDQTGVMMDDQQKVRWSELPAPDAWHLCAQLVNVDSAEDWLTMAKALGELPDGKEWSRRAAHWSFWLSAQTTIDAAKLMKKMGGSVDPKLNAPPKEVVLDEANGVEGKEQGDPEREWNPAAPWPLLTAQEQADAVAELKADMIRLGDAVKKTLNLAENDFFLFYTDMDLNDAQVLLEAVTMTYQSMLATFDMPPAENVFWGKCVIIHCGSYEMFAEVQKRRFGSGAVQHMGGMTHRRGPQVHVVTWQYPDESKLHATIPHEIVHAFMARYRTARELPLWLEEGLADYVASIVMVDSPMDKERRPTGVNFIKTIGPVNAILDMRCTHDGWPGPRNAGYAVGYLMVELMFQRDAGAALRCIRAIKDGKPWETALEEDFGLTRDELVLELIKRYRPPSKIKPPAQNAEPPVEAPQGGTS